MSFDKGDQVRIRHGVTPWYGWNGVKPFSVGSVIHVEKDGDCLVQFPECSRWMGRVDQLERPTECTGPTTDAPVRRNAKVDEDCDFCVDGWAANRIRPGGSKEERAIFDGISQMFTARQPRQLHQGRDVREDCPQYNGIRPVAIWQVTNETGNNVYDLHRCALKKRLARTKGLRLVPEETKLSCFHADLPLDLDSTINEVLLLHGTKPDKVQQILTEGLNERLCNGIFGSGVYLAEDVEKIDQYTELDEEPYAKGTRMQAEGTTDLRNLHARLYGKDGSSHPGSVYYAFVCRVTLGHAIHTEDGICSVDDADLFQGGNDGRELTHIQGTSERYHSLVAEVGSRISRFREFVVYHAGTRVLPEFLVAYHRTQDDVPVGLGYQRRSQQQKRELPAICLNPSPQTIKRKKLRTRSVASARAKMQVANRTDTGARPTSAPDAFIDFSTILAASRKSVTDAGYENPRNSDLAREAMLALDTLATQSFRANHSNDVEFQDSFEKRTPKAVSSYATTDVDDSADTSEYEFVQAFGEVIASAGCQSVAGLAKLVKKSDDTRRSTCDGESRAALKGPTAIDVDDLLADLDVIAQRPYDVRLSPAPPTCLRRCAPPKALQRFRKTCIKQSFPIIGSDP